MTAVTTIGRAARDGGKGEKGLSAPRDDEHIIKCSICGRELIVKDTVNNGVAFLSHLKIDHGITYTPQLMTKAKQKPRPARQQQQQQQQEYSVAAGGRDGNDSSNS